MFSVLKKRMRDTIIKNNEQLATAIVDIMYKFDISTFDGFFRRTL